MQEDVFKLEAEDVGPIYKVRIGHDDKGTSSGWFLESMHIQRFAAASKKSKKSNSMHLSNMCVSLFFLLFYF